jgi:hypothetical protein
MHDILDVIENIQDLYENNSNLAVLKDFERVLDEMDIYAYDNWEDGELAYGPQVDRHWISVAFMWPKLKMPDPTGAERLLDIGCKVKYEQSHLIEPVPIKTENDFRPGTKKGKLERKPIWLVNIMMPKKLAFDMYKGYMDKLRNDNEESLGTPVDNIAAPGNAPVPPTPPVPGMPPSPTGAPVAGGMPPTPVPGMM